MTVKIRNIGYTLSTEGRSLYWETTDVPTCPACGERLTDRCDDITTLASIHTVWDDAQYVNCDNCGVYYPIDDAPPLTREMEMSEDRFEEDWR